MKKKLNWFFLIITSIFLISSFQEEKTVKKYWIFFDKKQESIRKINTSEKYQTELVSKRALERRKKVKPAEELLDETDLPLNKYYIRELEYLGIEIENKSRWFNAVTAYLSKKQIDRLLELNFVTKIEPVVKFKRRKPLPVEPIKYIRKYTHPSDNIYNYGPSFSQIEMSNIHKIHNLGITGKEAIVGFLDTGYMLDHQAFQHIRIIDQYDFIFKDKNTANEPGDNSSQHNHGTATLSNVGGYKKSKLIGVAFNAEFALAKTEDLRMEMPVEEDNWIAGLEWLDSLGCDVVNSSLGYTTWDDGTGYTQEDLDGNTARTTIAADLAVEKGMVVVNSAGNERNTDWGTISTPADGFNVLAIGAVNDQGIIESYSSPGPTADGRIKPDVCAKSRNFSAYPTSYDYYAFLSGTSLSAPIVTGTVALIISANPGLNSFEIIEALKNTASKSLNPDNDYGWGIVDGYQALFYHGLIFIPDYNVKEINGNYYVYIKILAEQGIDEDNIYLYYSTNPSSFSSIKMTESEESIYYAQLPVIPIGETLYIYFSVIDNKTGQTEYYPNISANRYFEYKYGDITLSASEDVKIIPSEFELKQNYPNPFNSETKIIFNLPVKSNVKLEIFNILGQKVRILIDNSIINAGKHILYWDGLNNNGNKVASGVYIYRMIAGKYTKSKKMVLIK